MLYCSKATRGGHNPFQKSATGKQERRETAKRTLLILLCLNRRLSSKTAALGIADLTVVIKQALLRVKDLLMKSDFGGQALLPKL